MLGLKALRENPDAFRAGLARRGAAEALDSLLGLDERKRRALAEVEDLRHELKGKDREANDARLANIEGGMTPEQPRKEHKRQIAEEIAPRRRRERELRAELETLDEELQQLL